MTQPFHQRRVNAHLFILPILIFFILPILPILLMLFIKLSSLLQIVILVSGLTRPLPVPGR